MNGSLKIGRLGKTEIRLHISMLLLIPYAFWAFKPQNTGEAVRAFVLIGLIFLFVLLHELGHTLISVLFKVPVPSVVLWPLGGVAVSAREPDYPWQMLLIAAAGPLTNFLLAGGLLIVWIPARFSGLLPAASPLPTLILAMLVANLSLAVFNLIPMYPLDGGRMLQSLLQWIFGERWSNRIMLWISLPLALVLLAVSFFLREPLLGLTSLLLVLAAGSLDAGFSTLLTRGYAALVRRPEVYFSLGDYDSVIELCDRRIQRNARDLQARTMRAYAWFYLEDRSQTKAEVDQVLQIDPRSFRAVLLEGALCYAAGDLAGARLWADRSYQVNPEWFGYYANRAVLLRDQGDLPAALADLDHTVQLDHQGKVRPRTPLIYQLRSMVHYQMGHIPAAQADWEEAYHLAPRSPFFTTPDSLEIISRQPDWVRAYFDWLIEKTHQAPLAFLGRAVALARLGDFRQAAADYTRAEAAYSATAELYYGRGKAFMGLGDWEHARQDFTRARRETWKRHLRRQVDEQLAHLPASPLQ